MPQTMLTHSKMIENLIGDFVPTEHPELYKAGFNFVADLIPVNSELWHNDNVRGVAVSPSGRIVRGGSHEDGHDIGEACGVQRSLKILSVWRKVGGVLVPCEEIPWSEYSSGKSPDSLNYHGNAYKNPVYSISDGGRLFISPVVVPSGYTDDDGIFAGEVPSTVNAYCRFWSYEPGDYHNEESYHIQAMFGYPKEAQLLAIIKSSMNILNVKIAESVHEDEDSELLQLQQAQMQQLQQWFEMEANRLNLPWRNVGLEEAK